MLHWQSHDSWLINSSVNCHLICHCNNLNVKEFRILCQCNHIFLDLVWTWAWFEALEKRKEKRQEPGHNWTSMPCLRLIKVYPTWEQNKKLFRIMNKTKNPWESRYVRKCYLTVVKKVLVPNLLCNFFKIIWTLNNFHKILKQRHAIWAWKNKIAFQRASFAYILSLYYVNTGLYLKKMWTTSYWLRRISE